MNAPDAVDIFGDQIGAYMVFDPTKNILLVSQLPSGSSEPTGGFDGFNTTTNRIISFLMVGGYEVNSYNAGRQTVRGNFVIVTQPGAESEEPVSYENSMNPAINSVSIPAIKPKD